MFVRIGGGNKIYLHWRNKPIIPSPSYFRSSPDGNCLFNAASIYLCHTEVLATLLWLLTTLIGLFFNAGNYTTNIVFEKGFKTSKSSFHASLKLEVTYPFSCDIECVEACEQFELFWTSTAPESSVLDHFVP